MKNLFSNIKGDAFGGITAGIVALPLALAFGEQSGLGAASGLYGAAISKTVEWLEKAVLVAENQPQADALKLLIDYYQTGDLKTWDAYNIAWCGATDGDIDYINSFIEVDNKKVRESNTGERI